MKPARILIYSFISVLSGCDNNATVSVNPGKSLNNVPETTKISACSNKKSGGSHDEDFVHVNQSDLLAKITAGKNHEVFDYAFEKGDIIFGTFFTREQGSGANVGGNTISQYTSIPRADLTGNGEWANHVPKRATGPNAQSCVECHIKPFEDGAGGIALNVHRDPEHTGDPKQMIQRSTPHLFGLGALQLLAEEMTSELKTIVKNTGEKACSSGKEATAKLLAKEVYFGSITMTCADGKATVDSSQSTITGIEPDLVVRPFEWKKSVAFVRDFMRGASHNEIGMQATEIVGKGVDGDGDGVTDELSIGDLTAFSVYMAAQPRPTTKLELEKYDLIELSSEEKRQIEHGEKIFGKSGIDCASCHMPQLTLKNTIFSEPSKSPNHRDSNEYSKNKLPINLEDEGVTPDKPITFDLTKDIPENVLCQDDKVIRLGALEKENGLAIVRLYGDLKQHYMGDDLAEAIHEEGNGHMAMVPYEPVNSIISYDKYKEENAKSTFGTKELWGVACTGPWLHDGRATSLREAILLHGGDAAPVRDAFNNLDEKSKHDLIAFLGNQVLFMQKADATEIAQLSDVCELKELQE